MRNANGTGSIVKFKGNRRRPFAAKAPAVYVGNNPNPVQKIIGWFATRKEAVIALGEYLKSPKNLDSLTVDEMFEKIIKHANLNSNTAKNYTSCYKKYWKNVIGNKKLSELKIGMFQDLLDTLTSTKHTVLSVAKMIANYACEFEFINRSFADFLTIPKADPSTKKIKTIYTTDEILQLHKNKDYFSKSLLIYLYTGFRKDELLFCPREAVHLDTDIPYIQTGNKTEAGKDRIVPIHPRILPIVKEYMAFNEEYFFPLAARKMFLSGGTRERNFKLFYNNKHCLHETRHTFRSELDRVEHNISIINKLMGHSGDVGIKHYTHKSIEELYETISRITFNLGPDLLVANE